ncbi:restriction endonuclease subunit S [Bacillus toyonensis]|uniref:restriction endonuclease subunit S n=2 Tax=Bacillaceae TaxID=186817 RepID=UPI003CF29B09
MQTKRLGEILRISGKEKGGIEPLPVMFLKKYHGLVDQTEKSKNRIKYVNTSNYRIVQKNELVTCYPIAEGLMGFQKKYKKAYVSRSYDVWKLREDISCDMEFIDRYLKSKTAQLNYESQISRGFTKSDIAKKNFLSIRVPFPPLNDQRRIADVLMRVELLIAKRKESIEALNEILIGTFIEMFGDPVRNEKGWETKELKNFGEIINGNTPSRKDSDNYSPKFIEWIKTNNITLDEMYLTKATEYLSKKGLVKAKSVQPGAILVSCTSGSIESIGRAAIANRSVAFNQQIIAIQPNEKINSLFLYWLFKISRLYIQFHAKKGIHHTLTKGDFERIKMICPSLIHQEQFAVVVEKVESLKVQNNQSLDELKSLYSSLSQRAFKGELDLGKVPVIYEADKRIELEVEEHIMTRDNNLKMKGKDEFTDKDLVQIMKKYSGKIFSYNEIWKEIESVKDKKTPSRNDIQNRIIRLLESDQVKIQQVFDKLTAHEDTKYSEKQIAFRSNYEN